MSGVIRFFVMFFVVRVVIMGKYGGWRGFLIKGGFVKEWENGGSLW